MGLFGKLFGGGRDGNQPKASKAPRPPRWAREAFGDYGDRYARFAEVVRSVAADADIEVSDDDIRSGSLTMRRGYEFREWVLDSIAHACGTSSEERWPELVEEERRSVGFGAVHDYDRDHDHDDDHDRDHDHEDGDQRQLDAGDAETTDPKLVIEPWGCVYLDAGDDAVVAIVLPIVDRLPLARASKPAAAVVALVTCNGSDEGHLATTELARLVAVERVHAVDRERPIDRGRPDRASGDAAPAVEIRALDDTLEVGALRLAVEHGCVIGRWAGGQTIVVGDAIPLSLIGVVKPTFVVGKLVLQEPDDAVATMMALAAAKQLILLANVPGADARTTAKILAMLGASSLVAFGPTVDPAAGISKKAMIVAHLIAGEVDEADQIAADAIAAGDDVDEMTYQRAMIALMRHDDAAAMTLLDGLDTPHAQSSRASIASVRGDADAPGRARAVLERMPGDSIAIRGAVLAHVQAGDRDAATKLLAEHRSHLDVETALGLEQLIARPDEVRVDAGHTFPQHASFAMEAIEPIVTARRYAEAEPMLRRVRGWDPGNYAITAELGVVLASQDKLDDAIAVYDESIARGGGGNLLRFNRANCLVKQQRFEPALADYRWCIDAKPDWHEARLGLASLLHARGDHDAARDHLDELVKREAPPHYIAALEEILAG